MAASVPLRLDRLVWLPASLATVALVLLLAGLAGRWRSLLPWALAWCGAEYTVFLLVRSGSIDGWAPLYAACLLVAAELAYWALEPETKGTDRALTARRLTLLAAACLSAGGVGALILSAAELVVRGGVLLELLGVAAAVAALLVLARLARAE